MPPRRRRRARAWEDGARAAPTPRARPTRSAGNRGHRRPHRQPPPRARARATRVRASFPEERYAATSRTQPPRTGWRRARRQTPPGEISACAARRDPSFAFAPGLDAQRMHGGAPDGNTRPGDRTLDELTTAALDHTSRTMAIALLRSRASLVLLGGFATFVVAIGFLVVSSLVKRSAPVFDPTPIGM